MEPVNLLLERAKIGLVVVPERTRPTEQHLNIVGRLKYILGGYGAVVLHRTSMRAPMSEAKRSTFWGPVVLGGTVRRLAGNGDTVRSEDWTSDGWRPSDVVDRRIFAAPIASSSMLESAGVPREDWVSPNRPDLTEGSLTSVLGEG